MTNCPICEEPGDKRCTGCEAAFYCSVSHQKEHWKKHKKDCRVFIVQQDMQYGRHLVASRDIVPGTIIMSESPIMVGPKQNTWPLCLGCYKIFTNPLTLYYCSSCSLPMCGPECEKVMILKSIIIEAVANYIIKNETKMVRPKIFEQCTFDQPVFDRVTGHAFTIYNGGYNTIDLDTISIPKPFDN